MDDLTFKTRNAGSSSSKKSMFLTLIVRNEQTKMWKTNFISVSFENDRTWSLTNYRTKELNKNERIWSLANYEQTN